MESENELLRNYVLKVVIASDNDKYNEKEAKGAEFKRNKGECEKCCRQNKVNEL